MPTAKIPIRFYSCMTNGNAYFIIDDFYPNQDTSIIATFKSNIVQTRSWIALFGSRSPYFAHYLVGSPPSGASYYNASGGTFSYADQTQVQKIEKRKNITYINGTVVSTLSYATFSVTSLFSIFGSNNNNVMGDIATSGISLLSNFEIYNNTTLIRDLYAVPEGNTQYSTVPAPTGGALWCKITKRYYAKQGTGTFTYAEYGFTYEKLPIIVGERGSQGRDGFISSKTMPLQNNGEIWVQPNGTPYIQNSTQEEAIHIGISAADDVGAKIVWEGNSITTGHIMGASASSVRWHFPRWDTSSGNRYTYGWGDNIYIQAPEIAYSIKNVHTTQMNLFNNRKVIIDGTEMVSNMPILNIANGYDLYLFGYNDENISMGIPSMPCKIQLVQITKGANIVRHLVPVQQGSTEYSTTPAPSNCLWDKVTQAYFQNFGNGAITYGEKTFTPVPTASDFNAATPSQFSALQTQFSTSKATLTNGFIKSSISCSENGLPTLTSSSNGEFIFNSKRCEFGFFYNALWGSSVSISPAYDMRNATAVIENPSYLVFNGLNYTRKTSYDGGSGFTPSINGMYLLEGSFYILNATTSKIFITKNSIPIMSSQMTGGYTSLACSIVTHLTTEDTVGLSLSVNTVSSITICTQCFNGKLLQI